MRLRLLLHFLALPGLRKYHHLLLFQIAGLEYEDPPSHKASARQAEKSTLTPALSPRGGGRSLEADSRRDSSRLRERREAGVVFPLLPHHSIIPLFHHSSLLYCFGGATLMILLPWSSVRTRMEYSVTRSMRLLDSEA